MNIPGPVALVAIAGTYRLGKSFLLNRLFLGQNFGFDVDGSINACTKGMWIWSQYIYCQRFGGPITLLVVDTEGLGDTK